VVKRARSWARRRTRSRDRPREGWNRRIAQIAQERTQWA